MNVIQALSNDLVDKVEVLNVNPGQSFSIIYTPRIRQASELTFTILDPMSYPRSHPENPKKQIDGPRY